MTVDHVPALHKPIPVSSSRPAAHPRLPQAHASGDLVRIALQFQLAYQVGSGGADFIFGFHCAQTPCQTVVDEALWLNQPIEARLETDPLTHNRCFRLRARPGELLMRYDATVDIAHRIAAPEELGQQPIDALPLHVARYILPSRYCESDRLSERAFSLFGRLAPGYARVLAVQDWVRQQVRYVSNTSDSCTSAVDTISRRRGVCRDFVHVMIAMCRALNLPARFTTGTDYGASPTLGPPDFHAYVEVFLGGRWCIFDPSGTSIPMGLVRLATGRDAADVAFATMFGDVEARAPRVCATVIEDPARRFVRPLHLDAAISTDLGHTPQASLPLRPHQARANRT